MCRSQHHHPPQLAVPWHLHGEIGLSHQLAKLAVDIIEAGFPPASNDDFKAVKMIAKKVGNTVDVDSYVPIIHAQIGEQHSRLCGGMWWRLMDRDGEGGQQLVMMMTQCVVHCHCLVVNGMIDGGDRSVGEGMLLCTIVVLLGCGCRLHQMYLATL